MTITHELILEAPVEQVWALTVDVESWPSITSTMTSVERLDAGPLRLGSRARIKQPGQPVRIWTVNAFEPNKVFAWETKAFGVRMTGSHRLERVADGCRNVLAVELTGGPAKLLEAMLRGQFRKAITAENEGFRAAAESARQ